MLIGFLPFARAEEGNVYVIHVSSFENRNKAEREISNLSKLNLDTFYKYEMVEGKGAWFRVYIGTFNDKKEAQSKGSELIDKGIISYFQPLHLQKDLTTGKESVQSNKLTEQYFKKPEELKTLPVIKIRNEVDEAKKDKPVQNQQQRTTGKESVQSNKLIEWYFKAPEELKTLPVIKNGNEATKKTKGSTETNKKSAENTGNVIGALEIKVKKAPIILEQAKDFKVASQTMKKTAEVEGASREKSHKPRTILDNTDRATKKAVKGTQHSKSPFSLSLNAGGFRSGGASDFEITEVSGAVTNIYALKTMASQIAFASSYRVHGDYDLYGDITYLFGNRIKSMFLSLGPKKTFDISDWASIYLKGGAVYGNFNWNGPPGDFEKDYGLEAGFGANILRTRIKVGLDFLYRNIEFDYNAQGISGVSASSSSIDFSGFSISGSIKYFF